MSFQIILLWCHNFLWLTSHTPWTRKDWLLFTLQAFDDCLLRARCWGSESRVTSWVTSSSLNLLKDSGSQQRATERKWLSIWVLCFGLEDWSAESGALHVRQYTPRKRWSPAVLCCSWRWEGGGIGGGALRDSSVRCASAISLQKCCPTGNCTYIFKGIVL